jgi:NADH-quinone oxidoreductase subunit H
MGNNNKYSLLGAMRSGAQIVAMNCRQDSVLFHRCDDRQSEYQGYYSSQQDGWWIFKAHIPALIVRHFIIAVTAETNRAIFDMASRSTGDSRFHTEYSGMRFALFFRQNIKYFYRLFDWRHDILVWMPLHIGHWQSFNHVMDYIPSSICSWVKQSD